MAAVVTGLGIVSALGFTASETWQHLLQGKTAIALQQPFGQQKVWPLALVNKQPQSLDQLLQPAVAAALHDAGLTPGLPRCGVVIGSSRGYQGRWEQFMRSGQIDSWLETLPHMGALTIARAIGSRGPVLAPMAACATGLWAIAQAAGLIQSGQCEQVLVGAGEAAITPLTLAGFEQMRALAQTGCYPFDQHREGLVLGEGAAVLVLEAEAKAAARSARVYGRILGAGLTADANHVTAPDTASRQGGLSAIKTCLERSGLDARQVSLLHAHGTGTLLNDAYEAALIQTIFSPEIPVTATKGATGHTLGASGALGAAICLLALHHQQLPPCTGLQTPAFALNLVSQTRAADLSTALCFSFGFGGQNAVLAFGRCV